MKKIILRIVLIFLILIALAAVYTFLFPLEGKVKAFDAPETQGYTGDFAENEKLADVSELSLDGYARPETILYRDGYLYSSVHGQLLRTAEDGSGTELIYDSKDGETLGFTFDGDGNIIFTDPRFEGKTPGVFKVNPEDAKAGKSVKATPVCTEIDGEKLSCPDAVTVAENGIIYFTDAHEFSPVEYKDADLAFEYEAYYHSSNGKVCAYDPKSGKAWVVASGFSGANGIDLSFDGKYLYVCETMEYCVWRIPIDTRDGVKGDGAELFLSNLPGCVDNLTRGQDGRYWVGLVSQRNPSWDEMLGGTMKRIIYLRYNEIPDTGSREATPETGVAAAFAFDDEGNIEDFIMATDSRFLKTTGVCETENRLYLHGNNYAGVMGFLEK